MVHAKDRGTSAGFGMNRVCRRGFMINVGISVVKKWVSNQGVALGCHVWALQAHQVHYVDVHVARYFALNMCQISPAFRIKFPAHRFHHLNAWTPISPIPSLLIKHIKPGPPKSLTIHPNGAKGTAHGSQSRATGVATRPWVMNGAAPWVRGRQHARDCIGPPKKNPGTEARVFLSMMVETRDQSNRLGLW